MSNFEEQLATALIAKMAGSNLMEVDKHTVQQSSLGPATRINPASFLTNIQQRQEQQRQEEVQRLNAIAEQKFPIQPSLPLIEPLPPLPLPQQTSVSSDKIVEVLMEINNTLKELVECQRALKTSP
jgi:hypothetical protein